jgi:hypothetical protein
MIAREPPAVPDLADVGAAEWAQARRRRGVHPAPGRSPSQLGGANRAGRGRARVQTCLGAYRSARGRGLDELSFRWSAHLVHLSNRLTSPYLTSRPIFRCSP